jgi:membrane protein implicated in regulation of membrane protease activity
MERIENDIGRATGDALSEGWVNVNIPIWPYKARERDMDYWTIGLLILIIGIALMIVEVLTPGQTFMAIPGTVMVVLGIIAIMIGPWLFSAVWYAPVIALAIALPVTAFTMWMYQKLSLGHPPTTTVGDSLIGRQGIVTETVLPNSVKGKVRIGTTIWSATSDEEIEKGAGVEIVGSAGVHVHVEKIEKLRRFEKEMRSKEGQQEG